MVAASIRSTDGRVMAPPAQVTRGPSRPRESAGDRGGCFFNVCDAGVSVTPPFVAADRSAE